MPDEHFATHLDRSAADPGQTVVLISMDDKGGMVCQTRGVRARDFVMAAQSLLSQAADILDVDDPTPVDEDLLGMVQEALNALPDGHLDE